MSDEDLSIPLAPAVVRAARALLAWSQKDLSEHAMVATSTIADFERGHRTPVANNAAAIRRALEDAGISFLPNGAVMGSLVLPKGQARPEGVPIRLIDEGDLWKWADSLDASAYFSLLVERLIRATHPQECKLRFPAGDGIRHSGFDGWSEASEASTYVPAGKVAWELTVQRRGTEGKASADISKRAFQLSGSQADPETFVFVTLRTWPEKDRWAAEQQAAGPWRRVLAYDAADLVHWIEQAPAVGLWLAKRLNLLPEHGLQMASSAWSEWASATQPSLTEDLVLADRDEDAKAVHEWLREAPSQLAIQATTVEEGVAFAYAAVRELPSDIFELYDARMLVVAADTAARALMASGTPLIVLSTQPDAAVSHRLALHGHHVLQIYDDQTRPVGDVRELARPRKDSIEQALMAAGVAQPRARALSSDSGRNLSILRRLMPLAPGRLPAWAAHAPPHALICALLAGGWDENVAADVAALEQLSGQSFADLVRELVAYVGNFDSPLRKSGTVWRVASPKDAWFQVGRYISQTDIERFQAAAVDVLGSADPAYQVPPQDRWLSALRSDAPRYSQYMRQGFAEVLILLAVWGDRLPLAHRPARVAGYVVSRLLDRANAQRWWSLSRDLKLLAEAAPDEFLDAVERSLDAAELPLQGLLESDGSWMGEGDKLHGLLWALEALAWSEDFLPRVTFALARMSVLDESKGTQRNRPGRSLREIFLLWLPQTHATLSERLQVIDALRRRHPDAAWRLMLGILPHEHDSSTLASRPQWRDFSPETDEPPSLRVIQRGARAISARIVQDAGVSLDRWAGILRRLQDLAPEDAETALSTLEEISKRLEEEGGSRQLQNELRTLLNHHRDFAEAEWALEPATLERLDAIYRRLSPADPVSRAAWLFANDAALAEPSGEGWEGDQRKLQEMRVSQVQQLWRHGGLQALTALARSVERPDLVGDALATVELGEQGEAELLSCTLRDQERSVEALGGGFIGARAFRGKEPWLRQLVDKAKAASWGSSEVLARVLLSAPSRRWVWALVDESSPQVQDLYWRRAHVYWSTESRDDDAYAIQHLIRAGRARRALQVAAKDKGEGLATALVLALLSEAAAQETNPDEIDGGGAMLRHYVGELLQGLDRRADVPQGAIASLEWSYLGILERSSRPPKAIFKELARNPSLFVDLLKVVYKPSEDSGVLEPAPLDQEAASRVARQSYRLLELWGELPGTMADGSVDASKLERWIAEAQVLAQASGRRDIADDRIGVMLSACKEGTDGLWPAEPVRVVLDHFRSQPMLDGFVIGKSNRRGPTWRGIGEGGDKERELAQGFRVMQKALQLSYPWTAKALATLVRKYEEEAKWHDERSERVDW